MIVASAACAGLLGACESNGALSSGRYTPYYDPGSPPRERPLPAPPLPDFPDLSDPQGA